MTEAKRVPTMVVLVLAAITHVVIVALFDFQADSWGFDISKLVAYAALILSAALSLARLIPPWDGKARFMELSDRLQRLAWPLSIVLLLVSIDMIGAIPGGRELPVRAELVMCRVTSNVAGRPSTYSPMSKGMYCLRLESGAVLYAYPYDVAEPIAFVPGTIVTASAFVSDSWFFGRGAYLRKLHVRHQAKTDPHGQRT